MFVSVNIKDESLFLKRWDSSPSSLGDFSVKFKARECKIVWARTILSNLDDSEESVSIKTNLSVYVSVNTPCASGTLLSKKLLFIL